VLGSAAMVIEQRLLLEVDASAGLALSLAAGVVGTTSAVLVVSSVAAGSSESARSEEPGSRMRLVAYGTRGSASGCLDGHSDSGTKVRVNSTPVRKSTKYNPWPGRFE
jgi:hypothetical protein